MLNDVCLCGVWGKGPKLVWKCIESCFSNILTVSFRLSELA